MNSFYNLLTTLVLGILFIPTVSFSAPSISSLTGSISSGNTVSLSGTSFGSRGNYNSSSYKYNNQTYLNYRYKDFEDGKIEGNGFSISDSVYAANWSLQQGGKTNSKYYAKKSMVNSELGALSVDQSGTTGQWYISFWFMVPPSCQSGKFFRIYGTGSAANIYMSTGGSDYLIRGYSECSSSMCNPATEWGTGTPFQSNQWQRVEIWMDQGANTFTVYKDGVQQWTKNNWVGNPFGGNGHTIDLGNMIDDATRGGGTTGSYNYDDVYIDFTRARVEIGNASSWSNCTKKEVQLPLSWGDGTVSFQVNQGVFQNGETAYIYVVDTSGNVSNAKQITFGANGGNGPAAPAPPQNPTGVKQ